MTKSCEIVAVRGLPVRSGPHRLDGDAAWTMRRGVNTARTGSDLHRHAQESVPQVRGVGRVGGRERALVAWSM
jgi:hypothetical protein